jgi:hypothetical protein
MLENLFWESVCVRTVLLHFDCVCQTLTIVPVHQNISIRFRNSKRIFPNDVRFMKYVEKKNVSKS